MTAAPVGLVAVSHSAALARAAVALAREMAAPDQPIEVAAGADDGGFGTDAVAIAAAITAADRGAGVVVVMDLGSAVLSAELALELLDDPALADAVVLCPAPFVEGLVVAAVAAAGGAGRAEVAAEAVGALAGKAGQLGGAETAPEEVPPEPAAGEARGAFVVADPHGLHARPAARLVAAVRAQADARVRLRNATTASGWVPADSLSRVATLGALAGHRVEVAADGAGADAAVDAVLALQDADPAPVRAVTGGPRGPGAPRTAAGRADTGPLPLSPGVVVGPAHPLRSAPVAVPDEPGRGTAVERGRLDAAVESVRAQLAAARAATPGEEAGIFDAHLLLLDDPDLVGAARAAVDTGTPAPRAWADAAAATAGAFTALADPYLAGRAADVEAVGEQVLRELVGAPPPAPAPPGAVVVAADLTPAEVVALDAHVAGVVLAAGAATAHATILLRARGLPAVGGAGPAVLDLAPGTAVALDGGRGELVLDPAPDIASAFVERAAERAAAARRAAGRAGEPAVTRGGVRVLVGVNAGSAADAAAPGADLVGLLRTEFLFLGRDAAPGVDEQEAAYRAVAGAAGGRRVVLRTIDVGGDKPLPYLPLPAEANPFLGLRGIRLARTRPDLLADQLLAAVRVAHDTPLSVMFPMVAALDELLDARRALADAIARDGRGDPPGLQVGMMVEVPAAALAAEVFVPHVDFLSIGTNDLVQYALAAERGNPAVAHLADPLHPGVLALVAAVGRAAGDRVLVAVCGEAAADPRAAARFVERGVRELSVAPPAVAATKEAVRDLP